MAYAVAQDIINRVGNIAYLYAADPDGTGSPNVALVADALADAAGEMDAYLQNKYSVPVQPVLGVIPPPLPRINVDIAMYRMASRAGGALTDEIRRRYDDARSDLMKLGKGDMKLAVTPEPNSINGAPVLQAGGAVDKSRRRYGSML